MPLQNSSLYSGLSSLDESAPSKPIPGGPLPNLDYLRAVAVLLVCLDHLLLAIPGWETLLKIPPPFIGEAGVMIFFTHTSLVLMQSMERLKLRGMGLWTSFMLRRVFRIYPLSIAAIVFVTLLRIPPFVGPNEWVWLGPKALFANVALVQNIIHAPNVIAPLWSLPYEVQMYLVLPVIFLALGPRPVRTAAALEAFSVVCIAPLFLLKEHFQIGWLIGLSTLQFAPCFLSGVWAYANIKTVSPRISSYAWWVFAPAAIASYCLMRELVHNYYNEPGNFMSVSIAEMILAWPLCLLIGSALPYFQQSQFAPLNRTAHVIAKYSYGVYLGHVPIIWFSFERLSHASRLVQVGSFVVLIFTIPVISYHLLEAPCIGLGKRIADRIIPAG